MKKLRPTQEEKNKLIEDIIERLAWFNNKPIEDFDIDDLKKEYSTLPKKVTKPIIQITTEAYIKMLELVNQSETECSWHGLVKRFPEENRYFIYDILVYPQINSSTTTTTDEKEFAEWQMKLISDPTFPIEDLRFHGHSHVNMSVFSSGVDDQYQKDLVTKVENDDYYIFFIINKKMEICMLLYDFNQQILFEKDDINFSIVTTAMIEGEWTPVEDLRTWAKDELEQNAKTSRTTYGDYKPYQRTFGNYTDDEDEYSYVCDHFRKTKPIFKGVKNGSK